MGLKRTLRVFQNIDGLGAALKRIESVAKLSKENTRRAKVLRDKMRRLQRRTSERRRRNGRR